MRRVCFILVLILVVMSQSGVPKISAQSNLVMMAQPAYNGFFKYGEWLPVYVTVENSGPDVNGEIRATVKSGTGELEFSVPAELPSSARKRFTLYVQPNSFSRSVEVRLMTDEQNLLSQEVKVSRLFNDRYTIGVVAAEPESLSGLSVINLPGRREQPQVIIIPTDDLPDRAEGLNMLQALVLNDVDTSSLSPNQQAALNGWVKQGGRLILGGGAGAARTMAGLPTELQPVTLAGQMETAALTALEQYANDAIRVAGPYLLAMSQPVEGSRVLLDMADAADQPLPMPLVVERNLGAGQIDFVALDLTQSPFNAWSGTTAFVRKLLAPGAAWPDGLPSDIAVSQMRDSQMNYALTNLPALDLPSIRFLGILLAGYIVLVGPINYFLLRWRDKLAWAWVTIPGLTLAFSGLAYGVGFSLRGSDIIVNQIAVMHLEDDGQVSQSRTYVGIFSPSRREYDVEVSGRNLIRPLGEAYNPWDGGASLGSMSVVQGEPGRVRGLSVNKWSLQSFVAETTLDQDPGLVARLSAERNAIRGELVNQGQQTWENVMVFHNGQVQKFKTLAPGEQVEINLEFDKTQFMTVNYGSWWLFQDEFNQPGAPNRDANFKQSVVDSVIFNGGQPLVSDGPVLIAWLKDSPLDVSLRGRKIASQKTTFLHGDLPLDFSGAEIAVPPGLGKTQMLSFTGQAGMCGPIGVSVYQGTVEFRLSMPEEVQQVQPDRLDLYLFSDGGWTTLPKVEFFDREANDWVEIGNVILGINLIQNPERFYDPTSATMDVRVSSDNPAMGGGCLYFDLALEGKRVV